VENAEVPHGDALVERIRTGDAAAFAELVEAHYNALVRFVASVLGDADGAEDVVQDVMHRVWERRAQLDPTRAIRTYLFTAARNHALNRSKRERARRRLIDVITWDAKSEDVSALAPDMELDVRAKTGEETARFDALARAVAALPERRRAALALRFEQGMTHAEVGAVLGVSEKAAQQVVLRTIGELRRLLRP